MRPVRHGMAATAAVALLTLTGCTAGGQDPDPVASSPVPATQEGDGASTDEEADGADGAGESGAGVEDFDADDVVVSQEVTVPGTEDTATIGVLDLTVDGDVQVLRLAITPHFTSVGDSEKVTVYDVWGQDSFRPQLMDMANLKVYSPISDTGQNWTSDSVYTRTMNGEPMLAWAVYAAPEDDIDTVDIVLHEGWPQFTDVPVTR